MPPQLQQEEGERRNEWAWRFHNLRARGFDANTAFALADHVDVVHDADRLLSGGCPPELAARILL